MMRNGICLSGVVVLLAALLAACGADEARQSPVIRMPADDIYTALQQGDVERARQFIRRGEWDHAITDAQGKHPLEYAVEGGHTELVALMLRGGAYAQMPARDGRSMVELARQRGHDDIVQMLQQAGGR